MGSEPIFEKRSVMVCNRSISFQSQSLLIHQHFPIQDFAHPIKEESGVPI
jgi:hypothetical protein